ncbi:MAG: response regulator [Gammaproteobacteria bacterium]|jgi:signal transduction histidine kinase/DNA-binding NarL/FixJ family response regulator|nr:response regulator [Gammaproteobacteria bacterium]
MTHPLQQRLCECVRRHEDRLVEQVIDAARRTGYFQYTPALTRAWRESVVGLSADLTAALSAQDDPQPIVADVDYVDDPHCRFALETGRRHRARGVTLSLFLGLMKHFRGCYLELVRECDLPPGDSELGRSFVEGFFDRVEVALCTDWSRPDKDAAIAELTAKNRLLTNEKDKYLTLFESIQDPVFVLDPTGRVENLNAAAWRLIGIETDSGEAYYGHNRQLASQHRIAALLDTEPLEDGATIRMETPQGRRSFDVHRRVILDTGDKYSGSVLVLSDVTAHLRALAETEQANRVKSAFLATISHEIRTPLNGILGAVRLLGRDPLTREQQSYAKAIARSGERLQTLIDNVLDYSRIEAGKLALDLGPFSLREILDNVIAIMSPRAEELGLALVLDAPDLPSTAVRGDACKLQQVLLNLVGNALKFSERGEVTLRVRRVAVDQTRFEVEDRGPGIGATERERLFQPFTQLQRAASERDRGSGLGLAICRHLTEIMGGRIGVEPAQPRGSLFWLEISLPPVSEAAAPACPAVQAPQPCRPLSILLVEDEEVNQLVARGLLECAGHRVSVAASGAAALNALRRGRKPAFDLVMLDIRLPDMDGFEVAEQIRELTEWRLPVVAVTAHVARQELKRRDTLDALILKPFDPDELQRTLARLTGDGARVPFLDRALLCERLEQLGPARTAKIVAAFERVCSATLTEFYDGPRPAPATITAAAHRLRGAANGLGLRQLARQAAKVEAAQPDQAGLDALLEDLRTSIMRSRRVLAAFWGAMDPLKQAPVSDSGSSPRTDSRRHVA